MNILEIKNLVVYAGEKIILDDISLTLKKGEVLAIMGPNGSGKSTLANVLMGHPAYRVASGQIIFQGQDITDKKPEERAALGLFLVFQSPREVAGIELYPFLFDAYKSLQVARTQMTDNVFVFKKKLDKAQRSLKVGADWNKRYLNQGFSGGEKKKSEMLQLALFKPSLAIFDEVDSGLDVDALKVVGAAMSRFKTTQTSALIVTHYQRILKYLPPDRVIVLNKGKIVAQGGASLVKKLEREGFVATKRKATKRA